MTRAISVSLCCVIAMASSSLAQEIIPPIPHKHFPLEVGHRWTYRVIDAKAPAGQADPKRKVVVEVERKENYTEKKKVNGKDEIKEYTGFILKMTSGGKSTLDHVVILPLGVHRVHIAETPITPPMQFFKFGTNVGETWTLDSVSGNKNLKGTFSAKGDTVTVPFSKGPLSAWAVSFHNNKQGDDRTEVTTWYVENIGIVKQRIKGQSQDVVMELEKFERAK